MSHSAAHWGAAGQGLGSTLVAFSSPRAFAESLDDTPGLWETAVRRGAAAGRRARAKRKRPEGEGGAEAAGPAPASEPAPVAVLLASGPTSSGDGEGHRAVCELIEQKTDLKAFRRDSLYGAAGAPPPGPVGLLLAAPEKSRQALAELEGARQAETGGAVLQEGCIVVLTALPAEGLTVSRLDGPPYAVMGLRRDEADKRDVLGFAQWEALEAAVKEEQAVAEVAGLAVPSGGAAVFYPDGCIEALREPLVRLLPRPPPGSKAARYELLDEDGNALKLPQGFAPLESPLTVAADWVAEGGALAFTGAGVSKESGVPTYRDGSGLWKRYDAMEVSSLAGFAGEPAKVWDFEREFNELLRGSAGANAGHRALAELEALGRVDMVVTQNVDGFHQAAGSREVVELHGSEVHAVCLNAACGRRTEMARIFGGSGGACAAGGEDLWSPMAPGWGVRWPEDPGDTALQRSVRQQLTALLERAKRRRGGARGGGGCARGGSAGAPRSGSSGSSSSSGSDSGSGSSRASAGAGAGGGGGSGSSRSSPRQSVPKPLTEEELARGRPEGRVPICPHCLGGLLKPDGIFFGEALERAVLRRSLEQSLRSRVVLMVGTSGQVDPAAKLPLLAKARNGAKVIEVNIGETRLSKHADLRLLGASAEVLPQLCRLVAAHPRTRQLQALREDKLRQAEGQGQTSVSSY